MKKIFLIFSFLLIISKTTAQEISNNAIGFSFNDISFNSLKTTYQHKLSEKSRAEFNVDTNFDYYLTLSGFYERVWKLNNNFNWFAGIGASYSKFYNESLGLGIIGVEYNFESPIMVSIDIKPFFIGKNSRILRL